MIDFGYYNMDCMTGMKDFPDKFFDLAIVDPPYFFRTGTQKLLRKKSQPYRRAKTVWNIGCVGSAWKGVFQRIDTGIKTADHMGMQLF